MISAALLLSHDLLNLANLVLNCTGYFFVFAFDFQFALPAEFPGGLLDLTLYFVKRTFRLVLRAGFHCNTPSPRVTAVFD